MSPAVQVGVGLRPPHYQAVLASPPEAVDCFEVISENFLGLAGGGGGRPVELLEQVRARHPVRLHGVSMNLGSVDPLSASYLRRLAALADRLQPDCVSDHVCWTGQGGENLHDLLPLPWTEESLDHVADRVHRAQDVLRRRLLLENPSSYLAYRHSTLAEHDFLAELARRTGAGLLLDVNNVFVTCQNHGLEPMDYLLGLPRGAVAQFHLSGHEDAGPLRIDTHDREVCPEVWALFRAAVRRFGPLPTIVEWDDRLPPLATLLAEAGRARAILEEGADAAAQPR